MERAGLLVKEVCECLNIEGRLSELGVVLVASNEQKWTIEISSVDRCLIIYSEVIAPNSVEEVSSYYLNMNANHKMMRGAWIGAGADGVFRLYYRTMVECVTALQVVDALKYLVGLHQHISDGRT
ncbi:type III secretion system chaperone family protein [Pseudomonas sp. Z3-6]|uniref:hypothetical protein n=1 Tax=Pseudomonas sp. Z3-6 TaxID=2817411 RepID=UPI003DA7A786